MVIAVFVGNDCRCGRCISKDQIIVLGVMYKTHKSLGKELTLLPIYLTLLFYSNLEFPNSTNEWPLLTSQTYFQNKRMTSKTSFYLATFVSPRLI